MESQEYYRELVDSMCESMGGIDGVRSVFDNVTKRALKGEAVSSPSQCASARSALEHVFANHELVDAERRDLEAIVLLDVRPVFDSLDGTFVAHHKLWLHLNESPQHEAIVQALPSVATLNLNKNGVRYVGTGFLVGNDLLITNRHNVDGIIEGVGTKSLKIRSGASVKANFGKEILGVAQSDFSMSEPVMVHPYWDIALLRIPGISEGRTALTLSPEEIRYVKNREIAAIGYPGRDTRSPDEVRDPLYRYKYYVKRIAPGYSTGSSETWGTYAGQPINTLTHDASTLGGNSGSPVVDLHTGLIVAVHFGGRYLVSNYAVPSSALAVDSRIIDAGVAVAAGAREAPNVWQAHWDALN